MSEAPIMCGFYLSIDFLFKILKLNFFNKLYLSPDGKSVSNRRLSQYKISLFYFLVQTDGQILGDYCFQAS